METIFFHEDGKITSLHRYVHCPSFEAFARALKRTDYHIPDKPVNTRPDNRSLVDLVHRAPFEVSKHKGSYKFRLCSHAYSGTVTEQSIRVSINRSNLSAPVSEEQIQKFVSDYGYTEMEDRGPDGERQFAHFRNTGKDKTSWPGVFADNAIYVAKTKNLPGVLE